MSLLQIRRLRIESLNKSRSTVLLMDCCFTSCDQYFIYSHEGNKLTSNTWGKQAYKQHMRSVVFSRYSGFLYQLNWPPWYNWNIVESGSKHHNLNPTNYMHDVNSLIWDWIRYKPSGVKHHKPNQPIFQNISG